MNSPTAPADRPFSAYLTEENRRGYEDLLPEVQESVSRGSSSQLARLAGLEQEIARLKSIEARIFKTDEQGGQEHETGYYQEPLPRGEGVYNNFSHVVAVDGQRRPQLSFLAEGTDQQLTPLEQQLVEGLRQNGRHASTAEIVSLHAEHATTRGELNQYVASRLGYPAANRAVAALNRHLSPDTRQAAAEGLTAQGQAIVARLPLVQELLKTLDDADKTIAGKEAVQAAALMHSMTVGPENAAYREGHRPEEVAMGIPAFQRMEHIVFTMHGRPASYLDEADPVGLTFRETLYVSQARDNHLHTSRAEIDTLRRARAETHGLLQGVVQHHVDASYRHLSIPSADRSTALGTTGPQQGPMAMQQQVARAAGLGHPAPVATTTAGLPAQIGHPTQRARAL
ncbi:hypothetical protein [Micromonospora sp. SH-82]|uniref:hypothetical protein n=1 Tax=Micromonospora sp. SH-82 TaxID=3132938 RepID=UPI003EB91E4F